MENLKPTEKIRNVLSIDEIKESLNSLSEAQWIKLGKAANILSQGLAIEGQDILQLAFCKILEGKRKCPRDLPVMVFIRGVIESLVSAYIKKRKRDPLQLTVEIADDDDSLDINDLQPTIDTPEEILLAKQALEQIYQVLKGDEAMVVKARLDGYTPLQIQETVGLTPIQYASTLRAIRRKLDKLENQESSK